MERYKFPRIPHLPWSKGFTGDDERLSDISHFKGKRIVITEKLDGGNISIYSDKYIHARSVDGISPAGISYLKNYMRYHWNDYLPMKGCIDILPSGWRIIAEYLYAIHTIEYEKLNNYLFIINVIDDKNTVVDWHMTKHIANKLNIPTVPVIAEVECGDNLEWVIKQQEPKIMQKSTFGSTAEGYVIRNSEAFPLSEYGYNVAKYVRKDHVQPDAQHWSKSWRQATLYKEVKWE